MKRTGGLPIVWLVLTVLVILPVWTQRLLPMLDTPNHLALVRGWHNFHDPTWHISDFYSLRVRPVPYFLFYGLVNLFTYFVSIENANKIFLSMYLVLYPLSILALCRAFRRSAWIAVAGFGLAFSQNWIYGFSSYLMGVCLAFLGLATVIEYLRDAKRWRWAAIVAWSILAYFGHVMAWGLFGLCSLALMWLARKDLKRIMWTGFAMLPSLLFAVAAYVEETRAPTFMRRGGTLGGKWRDFPTAVIEFPKRVMELFPGPLDMLVLAVIVATSVALWFICRGEMDAEERARRKTLRVLGWMLAILYLLIPYEILRPMAWWYVAPRIPSFMVPLLLMLPMATPEKLRGRRLLLFVPLIIAVGGLPLKLVKLYRDFSARNLGFIRMVDDLPVGSTTMVVVRDMAVHHAEEESGDRSTSAPVYWHFSSWPMALRGGYSPYIFDQGIPLVPKPIAKKRVPSWAIPEKFELRQAPAFDYYLIRSVTAELLREPSLRVEKTVGDWTLLKRVYDLTDEP